MTRNRVLAGLAFCISLVAMAQASEVPVGLPFIENYSGEDFDFHPQNWCVAQDDRGILFFANTQGLLEFDGVSWRKHELIAGSSITVLKQGKGGRLYLGGRGDFGYLEFDPIEGYQFYSFADLVPEDQRSLVNTIWHIALDGDRAYFRSSRGVFSVSLTDETVEVIPGKFTYMERVGDRVYLLEKEKGLELLKDGKRIDAKGGEDLTNIRIYSGLPYDDAGTVLFASPAEGCFLYHPELGVTVFETEVTSFLKENRLYRGGLVETAEGRLFAYATYHGGVVLIDSKGKVRQLFNKASGLLDDKTHFVFQDRENALWVAMNNGIARVEYPSAFSVFDEHLGLQGLPQTASFYQGDLYVGTNFGLQVLRHPEPGILEPWSRFEAFSGFDKVGIETLSREVWTTAVFDDSLWVGDTQFLHQIRDGQVVESYDIKNSVYAILPVPEQDAILVGSARGLWMLKRSNGAWKITGSISENINTVWSLVRDDAGRIWMGTPDRGVIRVENLDAKTAKATLTAYGKNEGVPESWLHVSKVDGRVVIVPETGLYCYDSAEDRFVPDPLISALELEMNEQVSHLTEAADGSIWFMKGSNDEANGIQHAIADLDGSFTVQNKPMKRLVDVVSLLDIEIGGSDSNDVWFLGRNSKIYHYNPATTDGLVADASRIQANIRGVEVIDADIPLWYGDGFEETLMPAVAYENNALKFSYAAPSYRVPAATQYQVMLEGYQKDWSKWSEVTYRDFTGLPGGKYVFKVRAKDVLGNISEPAELAFSVVTPWYQQTWMILVYFLLFGGAMVGLFRWRVRSLKQKAEKLEGIVQERTAEIARQAEELKEMDRIKSHFFANISHEFRTPLTLILGPVESTLESSGDPKVVKQMDVVRRNAYRLRRLIDQLLYLSKLEAKQLKLRVHHGDLQTYVEQVVHMFSSAAEQRDIDLQFEVVTPLQQEAYFDPDVVEKVIYNLLSNAVKFTPEGGTITVSFEGGSEVTIKVADTGCGIAPEQQGSIFNRFYQNQRSKNSFQNGTGIGMALTRELLELHRGGISVESQLNKGTTFTVRFPIDIRVFDTAEIVDGSMDKEIDAHVDVQELTAEQRIPEADVEVDGDEKLILIVEDHDQVREYIQEHLEGNYKVIEARNGREGLERALDTIPDLIISDVMMPEMDGFEFCDQIKRNATTSHIPVILLTARAGSESRMEGWETGADDYLTKPFHSRELNVRIRKMIEQREHLKERFRKEGLLTLRDEKLPSAEEAFLKQLIEVVETNLSNDQFGVDELGRALGLGRRQLLRKLQASTGQTAIAFLRTTRLRKAKQYIESRAKTSVTEVAYEVGFASLSYFAKVFREEYGISPSELWDQGK